MGRLEGFVLRSQLEVLLRRRAFCGATGEYLLPPADVAGYEARLSHEMRAAQTATAMEVGLGAGGSESGAGAGAWAEWVEKRASGGMGCYSCWRLLPQPAALWPGARVESRQRARGGGSRYRADGLQ